VGVFWDRWPRKLNFIDGKLTDIRYIEILERSMLPSARRVVGRHYIYQEDNDPKHAGDRGCKLVKDLDAET